MSPWQQPGQDAGVRSVCDGTRGKSLREAKSVVGERIHCRSLNAFIAVAVDVVGTQRINGYEKDIWPHIFSVRCLLGDTERSQAANCQRGQELHGHSG